jgi:hypothetical protein
VKRTRTARYRALISLAVFFVAFAVAMVGNPLADEPTQPPQGGVPSVEATELEQSVPPVFREADDGPALRPNHPPIDQIPPMPMPQPQETGEPPTGPGAGAYYNAVTGETIIAPLDDAGLPGGFGQGGGYNGADGGGGRELLPATFYDMYEISNTGDFPWRMNVKLVIRFVDQCASDRWFVCSGTMRDAETVLTAGHCVYARAVTGCDIFDWAEEIWVYPGWDGVGGQWNPPPSVINPYGYGHGTYFGSWSWWTDDGNVDGDVGLIGVTRAVGMLTGWFGWSHSGSCSWHTSQTYNNASYPSENCPDPGLHTGLDMYYWFGNFDSCPDNQLQLDTGGGNCFDTVWGGMSGSGAYYIDGDSRYVHAVCSTSDRNVWGRYCRQWENWVNWSNDTFIPDVRGGSFDLQALDVNAEPATIQAGSSTTLLNHLATNATNGSANDTWTLGVYLSTNDNISTSDTLLSTQFYGWNFGAMSSVRLDMVQVTIPPNTPPGDYWIGVVYDSATDGNSANNDTDGWDAVPIHVTACDGTDTSCGIYPNCENCNADDGCYSYGNGCEERNYYCQSNSQGCNYSYSNRHTDYYDGWVYYCSGDTVRAHRLFHNFYCDLGTCRDHTSWADDQLVEDCNDHDGWVDTGITQWIDDPGNECQEKEQKEQDYRDYTCSGGACTYRVTKTRWVDTGNRRNKRDGTDCGSDYYDDWVYYCSADSVRRHRLFHDFYCGGGICQDHTSWVDDQLVEDCNDHDGWVDTGNTRWIDDPANECQEKEQKQQQYRDYTCSAGSCTYGVTRTRWVDTGNTRDKPAGTPSDPSPPDGATDVPLHADLDWSDASCASSYDVYFGTSPSPPYYGTVTASGMALPRLAELTHYFWQIVAKNGYGETWGPVWDLHTGANSVPTLGTVNPSSGSGPVGVTTYFSTTWRDDDGWQDLKQCYFHIGASPSVVGNVTLMYNNVKNKLWLLDDSGTTWTGGFAPGSANVLENSQAVVHCILTTANRWGNTRRVKWAIEFKPGYTGHKKTGLKCKDVQGATAKAKWKGTWTITP